MLEQSAPSMVSQNKTATIDDGDNEREGAGAGAGAGGGRAARTKQMLFL